MKIQSVFYDNLDTSDPDDPNVIIKCGFNRGDTIPTVDTLTNLFGYFKVIHTYNAKLRYFDWDGQVHLTKGKTDGHQGDP
jgi:hypothetical protein